MSRQQREPLRSLQDTERVSFVRLSRSASAPAAQVARARALLAVAEGLSYTAAARPGPRHASGCSGKKGLIERAYTLGSRLGLAVWCADEAGPFQAVPHPGSSWRPHGQPATQPHEYVRGGTSKILTLFHPATGQVYLQSITSCTNAVLHGWLKKELTAILARLPAPSEQA